MQIYEMRLNPKCNFLSRNQQYINFWCQCISRSLECLSFIISCKAFIFLIYAKIYHQQKVVAKHVEVWWSANFAHLKIEWSQLQTYISRLNANGRTKCQNHLNPIQLFFCWIFQRSVWACMKHFVHFVDFPEIHLKSIKKCPRIRNKLAHSPKNA